MTSPLHLDYTRVLHRPAGTCASSDQAVWWRVEKETPITAKKPYDLLALENQKLRERIGVLETEVTKFKEERASQPAYPSGSKVMALLESKDRKLGEYAGTLEAKAAELERAVTDLELRNEELSNSLAALKLFQDIFDAAPSALLGIDATGQLVQFNRAACSLLDRDLYRQLLAHYEQLGLAEVSPELSGAISRVLSTGAQEQHLTTYRGNDYQVMVFPLAGTTHKIRGVVLFAHRQASSA